MKRIFLKQGAEAKLEKCSFYGRPCLVKERFKKKYRHEVLDKSLTTQRIKSEVRAMIRCRTNGILTPTIFMVDMESSSIYMEYIEPSITVREFINDGQQNQRGDAPLLAVAEMIGRVIGITHKNNIIHGDLTTSNMLLTPQRGGNSKSAGSCPSGYAAGNQPAANLHGQESATAADLLGQDPANFELVLIDFGLTALEGTAEDKGVDLYVLERALLSTHPNTEHVFDAILSTYRGYYPQGAQEVIKKLDEVRLRGRKRTMVG